MAIASLRAESGDEELQNYLSQREAEAKALAIIVRDEAKAIAKNAKISAYDRNVVVYHATLARLTNAGYFNDEIIEDLLRNYWIFYEAFHSWLEKYCLQKDWLRRSFFIALRGDLTCLYPDTDYTISLHDALLTQLYGEAEGFNFRRSHVPPPMAYDFSLSVLTSSAPGQKTTQQKWGVMPFSIFDTPDEYVDQYIRDFETHLAGIPLFDLEKRIRSIFAAFIIARDPTLSDAERNEAIGPFVQHVYQFPPFKEAWDERREIVEDFREHLFSYIDSIMPAFGKNYKTNAGRPPNLARIEWILSWNLDGMTDKRVVDKFSRHNEPTQEFLAELRLPDDVPKEFLSKLKIGEISTFNAAKKRIREYDIPLRSGKNKGPKWRLKSIF